MTVGVPEHEVFAAADAVLARGERPTVERVRQELGRGSPARVGSLLDDWWKHLAARMKGETRLPELPGQVAQAFVTIWQQAINLALGVAEQTLDEQRRVLDTERDRIASVEDQAQKDSAKFRQHAAEAVAGRQLVETRLADLELLLEQRQTQIDDLHQQRDSLQRQRDEAQKQSHQLQQDLQALQQKAEQERATQETYVRGVEDRAHREVDRAREETKDGARKNKELVQQLDQLQLRLNTKLEELTQAQQQAAVQQARADTLDSQLQRFNKPAAPTKSRTKKTSGR
ncbi:plasmid replication region [Pseudomonas sp. C1C7]|uniref:DNA-binding protein n=1 Tax=Pseudomonas sp. C1C7 TaxID=2735272 RepID=UPI001586CC0E|nr:DNA-binding protein [Pseudomonas sp. C1C7]NUT76814.1 plasmid replication region [Pseudomonas sp. C1C7]